MSRRIKRGRKFLESGRTALDREAIFGKTIAIIGPADSVESDLAEISLDDFDLVVRMNRSLALAAGSGQRLDILVHNLVQSGSRAAGPLDTSLLRNASVKMVIFPHAEPSQISSRVLSAHQMLLRDLGMPLSLPSTDLYRDFKSDLRGKTPTAGATAIAMFLDARPKAVFIGGFTFFTTGYEPGYNDTVRTRDEAARWATATGLHDPERERLVIAQRIAKARALGTIVHLGPSVASALQVN